MSGQEVSVAQKVRTLILKKNKDRTGVCVRAMCAVGVRGSEKYPTELLFSFAQCKQY